MEQNGKLYLTSDSSILFDTNYRYKISLIEISYINKKGTKITILTNMDKFSKELLFDKNILIAYLEKNYLVKMALIKQLILIIFKVNILLSKLRKYYIVL